MPVESKRSRIAIGALLFEGNTLSPVVSEIADFENKYLVSGPAMLERLRQSDTEMGGAIQTLELYRDRVDIVPLAATHGGAGGRVSAPAYEGLRAMLLEPLCAAGRVDGLYLALHGAFIAQGTDDMEGDVLGAAREIVGAVPIAVSCDLHGHITPAMARHASFIIGYRHYPHDDAFDTGRRCTGLLLQTLEGRVHPVMRVRKAPMILPAQKQRTKSTGPMGRLHALARTREAAGEVLALSYFPVQPWLDLPGVGFAAVAVADGDAPGADRVALDLARAAWQQRHAFDVPLSSPAEAIARGLADDARPFVLADAGDCVGGGATGDSARVLAALLDVAPDALATMCIVDPETVSEATRAGVGHAFSARIGNKRDPRYGRPVAAEADVLRLFDGSFTYSGGILGGVSASMGPSAVLRIGAVEVVVASESSYEYADEQFRAAGVDAWSCKFVVVKNPMNFQQAYAGAAALITLDTPGPTTADLTAPAWSAVSRPLHPLDDGFEPEFEGF